MFSALEISGENVTSTPTMHHNGRPIKNAKAEILHEARGVGEQTQKIAARNMRLMGAQLFEHAGFRDAQTQDQQEEAKAAADEISMTPFDFLRHQAANDRAKHAPPVETTVVP